jgi:TRAP-type C4-dicarboxylate transport system permease small subunit
MRSNESGSLFQRTRQMLLRIEDSILVALILVIIGMAASQIVLRNLFGTGIVWGDILVRILVLWIGMTGAMVASRRGDHINIDILTRYLPPQSKSIIRGIIAFLTTGISSVAAYYSFKFVAGEYSYGEQAFAGVPVWICEVIIPLGFSIIALRYFILGIHFFLQSGKSTS